MEGERPLRAFLALDHPGAVAEAVARVQARLMREVRGEVRWIRPEGIHLTLKFFGDVGSDQAARIVAAVEPLAAATAPFALTVSGPGVFPDLRRPRVLWLGLQGEIARLLAFQRALEQVLGEIGFPREERPFRPHLTLARLKPGGPRGILGLEKALARATQKAREEAGAGDPFLAPALSLMQSTLTPQGAIYQRLKGIPLAGGQGGREVGTNTQ